ncbi:MAG: TRAP transporter substrate-binding protein DctP [Pseudomonadota bacterium]
MSLVGPIAGLTLAALVAPLAAAAQDIPAQEFDVLGTWRQGSMYEEFEAPLWETQIPEASGGAISVNIQAYTDVGVSGSEVIRLLDSGIYDFAAVGYTYIASGDAVFEGNDLALAPRNAAEARQIVEAYEDVARTALADIHDIHLIADYPFPAQLLACSQPFETLADLEGRKIRVYSTALGDLVEGLGATSVTIPLQDVVPALQRGLVDCGITSGLSMYLAGWQDVASHVYEVPVAAGIAFFAASSEAWSGLDATTQELISAEVRQFADDAWNGAEALGDQGIACLTGQGTCDFGEGADMTLVSPGPEDEAIRERVLSDYVLARWATRCGEDCAADWNAAVAPIVGVEAQP